VLATVSPDDAILSGVTTADGWDIRFERFLVSLGRVSLEGDFCLAYSAPEYSRVLNLTLPGQEKLALVYARGHCDFDVELSSPHEDAVLGPGTTEADRDFLRTPGDDAYTKGSGISIHVTGAAAKDGVTKAFAWSYRQRVDYATCSAIVDGREETGIDVGSNESVAVDLRLRGAGLFATRRADLDAELRFQPFADADTLMGNADGIVALDELALVELADLKAAGAGADAGSTEAGPYFGVDRWTTLRDFLYLGLFPLVIRFRGNGTCAMEAFPNDREPR
jgi:hypothetical protein